MFSETLWDGGSAPSANLRGLSNPTQRRLACFFAVVGFSGIDFGFDLGVQGLGAFAYGNLGSLYI